jgi:hypothetical protein
MSNVRTRLVGAILALSALAIAVSSTPQLGGYWGGI